MNNGAQNKTESALNQMRNQGRKEEVMNDTTFKTAMSDMVSSLMNMNAEDRAVALELVKANMAVLEQLN